MNVNGGTQLRGQIRELIKQSAPQAHIRNPGFIKDQARQYITFAETSSNASSGIECILKPIWPVCGSQSAGRENNPRRIEVLLSRDSLIHCLIPSRSVLRHFALNPTSSGFVTTNRGSVINPRAGVGKHRTEGSRIGRRSSNALVVHLAPTSEQARRRLP